MAINASLVCLLLSPIAVKKSTMSFEVFRQEIHKCVSQGCGTQGCGSLPWGSRAWQGDMGEVGLAAEPWEPLARQGTCKGRTCCLEHLRKPHAEQRNGKSGQWWLRGERQLGTTQNQVERSWRMGEGRLWLVYWIHMTSSCTALAG